MKIKKYFLFLLCGLFSMFYATAQKLNDYTYIMVPNQFSVQNEPNQYQLNKLTQFLFNKYNFIAFIEGENVPENFESCKTLRITTQKKGFLKTLVSFKFKDCSGKIIYQSIFGESRLKDPDKLYIEAIRNIFKDPNIKRHKVLIKKDVIKTIPLTEKKEKPNTNPSLTLKLRGKVYILKPIENGYSVFENNLQLGVMTKSKKSSDYNIIAQNLTGTGYFDDFGNFTLHRINPVTQKSITDVLERIH